MDLNLLAVLMAWYLTLSLLTLLVYARDKTAARSGAWRTPENTLHTLALLGGWPGAWFAQRRLRHKSRKQPFQAVFWITVLLNLAALGYLFSPAGAWLLEAIHAMTAQAGYLLRMRWF
jgi:uncharacterized membrane protein YsdA (DUF1294 family)